jgi:hypothetical protein
MRELGKWPRLLVAGEPVSEEQAEEILIRTASWYLSTNDRDFEKVVAELAGISIGRYGMFDVDSVRRFEARHHVLELYYLHNWRICSARIDGPYGWADWGGIVGCATWNVGKWPTVEYVTEDWQTIATAFPFLDLTAQLVTGVDEEDQAGPRPAVQWRVHAGTVDLDPDPVHLIRPTEEIDMQAAVLSLRENPFRERGVGRERLDRALQRVRAKFATGPAAP